MISVQSEGTPNCPLHGGICSPLGRRRSGPRGRLELPCKFLLSLPLSPSGAFPPSMSFYGPPERWPPWASREAGCFAFLAPGASQLALRWVFGNEHFPYPQETEKKNNARRIWPVARAGEGRKQSGVKVAARLSRSSWAAACFRGSGWTLSSLHPGVERPGCPASRLPPASPRGA